MKHVVFIPFSPASIPIKKYFFKCMAIIIIVFFILFESVSGQINKALLTFQFTLPQGEYRQTYPRIASGFLFGIVHQTKRTSFMGAGGEIGLMQVSGDNDTFIGYYSSNYNKFYSSSYNYIFTLAPKLRLNILTFKNSGKIFADLSIGTNVFFTHATISHDKETFLTDITDFPLILKIDSSADYSYWALRAGAGLGTEIPFGRKKNLSISLKFSYFYGSNAKYFIRPIVDNAQIILHPAESNTSMFLGEAGICFKIFSKKSVPRS